MHKFWAFSESQADKTHTWIALLSLVDSTTRQLTSPSGQDLDFVLLSRPMVDRGFRPRIVAGVVEDLYVVPAAGAAPKRLTLIIAFILGITWTPDGRDIVVLFHAWRSRQPVARSASGGTPRPVAGVVRELAMPFLQRASARLSK